MMQVPGLFIGQSADRGRGVFTARPLQEDDMIEICPVIIVPKEELKTLDKTTLFNYYFLWEKGKGNACIPLGFGSIYNHSPTPNAEVEMDIPGELMYVRCIRDITEGGEIFIDYLAGNTGETSLWFDVAPPAI